MYVLAVATSRWQQQLPLHDLLISLVAEKRFLQRVSIISLSKMPSNETIGNVGLVLLLVLTFAVTYCMLYQLPSSDYFDESWSSNGFCVSNPDSKWTNSHSLSFYADTFLALCIAYLYHTQPKSAPKLQSEMLKGAIMGVFGHGLGHLNLGMDARGMDLRFRPSEDISSSVINTVVSVGAFGAIFKGTLPLSSAGRLAAAAVIATAGFAVLDIFPKMNFVYAQAVIYIFSSLHLLTISSKDKAAAIFAMFGYAQLPVLIIGGLESTACISFLRKYGGHAIYDSSIALGTIGMELMSRKIETRRSLLVTKSKSL